MGSKKSSPVKVTAPGISKTPSEVADGSTPTTTSTSTPTTTSTSILTHPPQPDSNPALLRCKHISSMGEFLKMYHIVGRHVKWDRKARSCGECHTQLPLLNACLQCPTFCCFRGTVTNHCLSHCTESGHALTVEVLKGVVYCAVCKVWVWNDLMELVWEEALSSPSNHSGVIQAYEAVQSWSVEGGPEAKKHCGPIRGFFNLGNTCFMNSILQTMIHDLPLRKYFLASGTPHKPCRRMRMGEACIACELDSLFCRYYDGTMTPISPNKMLETLWRVSKDLAGYEQQDAHELYVTLRNALHVHLDGAMFNCDCIVHRNFAGVLQSDITCLHCGNVTETLDPFLDISLDIPPGCASMELEECLHRFTRSENVPAGNYICSSCHRNQPEIAKQLTIRSNPEVLSIHLKRFEHGVASVKIDTPVIFTESLSLHPYLSPSVSLNPGHCNYHLYAVVNHVGNLDSGHYTAFVKSRRMWFWIDDACVSECRKEDVFKSNAYMLFYIRSDILNQ